MKEILLFLFWVCLWQNKIIFLSCCQWYHRLMCIAIQSPQAFTLALTSKFHRKYVYELLAPDEHQQKEIQALVKRSNIVGQTLIFTSKTMFDRLDTSQNIVWQAELAQQCFGETANVGPTMFDRLARALIFEALGNLEFVAMLNFVSKHWNSGVTTIYCQVCHFWTELFITASMVPKHKTVVWLKSSVNYLEKFSQIHKSVITGEGRS